MQYLEDTPKAMPDPGCEDSLMANMLLTVLHHTLIEHRIIGYNISSFFLHNCI